jgi:hypothetical protein
MRRAVKVTSEDDLGSELERESSVRHLSSPVSSDSCEGRGRGRTWTALMCSFMNENPKNNVLRSSRYSSGVYSSTRSA